MKQINERAACDVLRKAGLTEAQIANLREFRQRYLERERARNALTYEPVTRETFLKKIIGRFFGG